MGQFRAKNTNNDFDFSHVPSPNAIKHLEKTLSREKIIYVYVYKVKVISFLRHSSIVMSAPFLLHLTSGVISASLVGILYSSSIGEVSLGIGLFLPPKSCVLDYTQAI